jgi:hypothetical protein
LRGFGDHALKADCSLIDPIMEFKADCPEIPEIQEYLCVSQYDSLIDKNRMCLAVFTLLTPIGWILAGGIDRFPIAIPDHADSSGFVVRISPRGNPDDWVVIDGAPIGGRAGPSIGYVVASCLTAA